MTKNKKNKRGCFYSTAHHFDCFIVLSSYDNPTIVIRMAGIPVVGSKILIHKEEARKFLKKMSTKGSVDDIAGLYRVIDVSSTGMGGGIYMPWIFIERAARPRFHERDAQELIKGLEEDKPSEDITGTKTGE